MTRHFPVVLEHESNGTVSAYVVGLPGVFAAADSGPAECRRSDVDKFTVPGLFQLGLPRPRPRRVYRGSMGAHPGR